MDRTSGNAGVYDTLPSNATAYRVDVVQHPAKFVGIFDEVATTHRSAGARTTIPLGRQQRLLRLADVDRSGDKDMVAPNDGRAPAASRDVDLPRDVVRFAPCVRQRRIVRGDTSVTAAELRPVLRQHHDSCGEQ